MMTWQDWMDLYVACGVANNATGDKRFDELQNLCARKANEMTVIPPGLTEDPNGD